MDISILVVEDDENICNMVKMFLQKANYKVDECFDGDDALEMMYIKNYDLVVLDIMLPGANGHEVLKEFRKISDAPVLMITALDDDRNQLKAFSSGTDDYVTKPFSMQILVKRVEALLRRSGALKNEIRAGKLTLYPENFKAEYDKEPVLLAPKEFEVLMLLAKSKGKIITHEMLLTKIWGYDFEGNEGIVHANINKLRNKLPANIIKTVKGIGYCLEGD